MDVMQEAERELTRSRKELKLKSIAFQNLKAKQDSGRDPLMRRSAAATAGDDVTTPAPPQSERVATTVRPQSAAAASAATAKSPGRRLPPPLVIPADSAEVPSPPLPVKYLIRTPTSSVLVKHGPHVPSGVNALESLAFEHVSRTPTAYFFHVLVFVHVLRFHV